MQFKKVLSIIALLFVSLFAFVACNDDKLCTVNFETNCDQKIEAIEVTIGSKITEPELNEIEGKEVDGWYTDSQFSKEWVFELDTVVESMTLYCKWNDVKSEENKKCTVNFVTNCDQTIESIEVTIGSKISEPQLNEIEGKEFDGWYTDSQFTDKWVFDTNTVNGTMTLYCKWNDVEIESKYDLTSIADAISIANETGETFTTEKYYVEGTITVITNTTYGNMKITDGTNELVLYGTYSADGSTRFDAMSEKPEVGDKVVVYGSLGMYGTTPEMKNGWIMEFSSEEGGSDTDIEIEPGSEITIEQALALCKTLTDKTPERYLIRATIKSIDKPEYGTMTIEDETGTISVYGSYSADGSLRYSQMDEKPYANYSVLLSCILQNYNGKGEIYSAWILEFEELEANFDEADYEEVTVNQARALENGSKVKLTGVVAKITYAFGMVPSGFYLVDNTNSIYVYDGQLAPRVAVGDKLTVCGSRTNWILDTEASNAASFGYTGCIQLENAYLIGDIESNNSVDLSWVTEGTVKQIMDTPASTNITTTIYKVNAYVKKVDNESYVNYYINDIDGKTGSYTYTQCSGADFAWLDEFDGKICTVYLSPINAKATKSSCDWRFLPIAVKYENYQFDLNDSAEYALTYHAVDQFASKYPGNPQKELITSVSNLELGIENVVLSYSSNDTNVIYFETIEDKVILNTKDLGTAQVTITATYGAITATKTLTIEVVENPASSAMTVKQAIATEIGTVVTVKGIVGPSLVNKVGFYLMDGESLIAIETTEAQMSQISIGNEVVVKGTRYMNKKDATYTTGQTCINKAEIIANFYGNHELPTSYFKESSGAEFRALNINEDHTTEVYVFNGKFEFFGNQFYKSLAITATDGTKVDVYNANAGQYSSITNNIPDGAEVTIAIVPCNWNSKTDYYRGCVLYVILSDGTVVYNMANFK